MTLSNRLKALALAIAFVPASALAQDTFDSDGDGYDDNSDNCTLVANPLQRDADGDHYGNLCDGDFNNDMAVNAQDLGIMRASFFTNDPLTDLNSDGVTNFVDLGIMRGLFFTEPGPTGTDPAQPPCTCYFSFDCPAGTFCDYGPGSFSTEDICVWRDIKPDGTVGAGCSIESNLGTGSWIPDICDGVCNPRLNGSYIGRENLTSITDVIEYWGAAMLNPSEAGGGPVDPTLAARALAEPFTVNDVAFAIGRQTADALAMSAGEGFHYYFCHYEGHPDDEDQPVVDLSADRCAVEAGRITIRALVAEMKTPGVAKTIMHEIEAACPNNQWHDMFTTQCESGPDALMCATQYIAAQAYYLRTPKIEDIEAADPVDLLMKKAGL
ncbi:MAG: hypothetical protein AAF610_00610 [Pseudomonadota bacterium]